MWHKNVGRIISIGSLKSLTFKIFAILMSLILSFSVLSLTPNYAAQPTKSTKLIKPLATNTNFIRIAQYSGTHAISSEGLSASNVVSSSTTKSNVCTYSNGNLYGHEQGACTVTLNMSNGDTEKYNISVYYSYPQPKASVINSAGNGQKLLKWAKDGNNDYVSNDTLSQGEAVTILYRAREVNDDAYTLYQYVETSSGKRGFLSSQHNTDRPMWHYYYDVEVGETDYIYPTKGDGDPYEETESWTTSSSSIVSVTNVRHAGYDNQARIVGNSIGIATITAKKTSSPNQFTSSSRITVYKPFASSISAKTNKATHSYFDASTNYAANIAYSSGAPITLTGECGNYWRITQARYIKKSDVYIPATSINVTPKNKTIYTTSGQKTTTLTRVVQPTVSNVELASGNVVWSSSNNKIAEVDQNGKVTAISLGDATITAEIDGKKSSSSIRVSNIPITGINLNKTSLTIKVGKKEKLTASVLPEDAYDKQITWSSSKENIAEVDNSGNITAISGGTCEIIASGDNGNVKAICKVKVNASSAALPIDDVIILPSTVSIKANISTGFNGNKITWSKPKGVKDIRGYVVNCSYNGLLWNNDKSKYLTTIIPKKGKTTYSYTDNSREENRLCYYIVYAVKDNKTITKALAQTPMLQIATKRIDLTLTPGSPVKVDLKWKKASGATKYVISRTAYVAKYNLRGTVKKVKLGLLFTDKDSTIKSGSAYTYKIVAYDKNSKIIKDKDQIISASALFNKKVYVSWKRVSKAAQYKVYRKGITKSKAKDIKTIKNLKTVKFTDKGLKENTKYAYKVTAINKKGSKRKSDTTSTITWWKDQQKNNKQYFSDNFPSIASNISDKNINALCIELGGDTIYPAVKYNLTSSGILQIHIYATFDGSEVEDRKNKFTFGVENGWSLFNIKGNDSDFSKKVRFTTLLFFHDKKVDESKTYGRFNANQKFINVQLGGNCKSFWCGETNKPHTHSATTDTDTTSGGKIFSTLRLDYSEETYIFMPTDNQLEGNEDGKKSYVTEYPRAAAHEMGHILGLDDAYSKKDDNDKLRDRMAENKETCTLVGEKYKNIMKSNAEDAITNDFEMILMAYSRSISRFNSGGEKTWQSYKNYDWINKRSFFFEDHYKFFSSDAITNEEDKNIEKQGK